MPGLSRASSTSTASSIAASQSSPSSAAVGKKGSRQVSQVESLGIYGTQMKGPDLQNNRSRKVAFWGGAALWVGSATVGFIAGGVALAAPLLIAGAGAAAITYGAMKGQEPDPVGETIEEHDSHQMQQNQLADLQPEGGSDDIEKDESDFVDAEDVPPWEAQWERDNLKNKPADYDPFGQPTEVMKKQESVTDKRYQDMEAKVIDLESMVDIYKDRLQDAENAKEQLKDEWQNKLLNELTAKGQKISDSPTVKSVPVKTETEVVEDKDQIIPVLQTWLENNADHPETVIEQLQGWLANEGHTLSLVKGKLDDAARENEQLKQQVKDKIDENAELSKQIKDLQDDPKRTKIIRVRTDEDVMSLENSEQYNDHLTQKNNELYMRNHNLEAAKDELTTALAVAQEENKGLLQDIKALDSDMDVASMLSENRRVQQENMSLSEENQSNLADVMKLREALALLITRDPDAIGFLQQRQSEKSHGDVYDSGDG